MKKKNESGRELCAIPTIYKGIKLKSRLEAQCAVLLDKLGWKWEYEPHSLMLPSGVTYIPDFWARGECVSGLIIECRGYESKRGIRQIDDFVFHLESGGLSNEGAKLDGEDVHTFLLTGPQGVLYYGFPGDGKPDPKRSSTAASKRHPYQHSTVLLVKCRCGWRIELSGGWCPDCGTCHTRAVALSVIKGKIFVNEQPVEDFNG